MNFSDKLVILRKNKGLTQEDLADKLNVSRAAVAKWEAGQSYPDIMNLIQLSGMMNVTVDYLVKDQTCAVLPQKKEISDFDELINFRIEAAKNTYAGFSNEVSSTRLDSHDYRFSKDEWTYHDTYVGGEQFAGEEAVWKNGIAMWSMNYLGRVLDERFSGDFLKAALRAADCKMPYRGPEFFQDGEYIYKTSVNGNMEWFQGYEEIYCDDIKVYECYYHGGIMK